MPTRVILASHNPVKARAAKAGFQAMFPGQDFQLEAVSVPSGVGDQPLSDAETLRGAANRAHNARQEVPTADFWIGIEGGVEPAEEGLAAFAWVVVVSAEMAGRARTATFYLPEAVAELVRQGKELGEADDIVFGRTNSKQEEGAVGILTGKVIDRAELYRPAVVMALIPFRNPDLYAVRVDDGRLVKEAEQRLAQAHLDLDLAVMEELLHPDYAIQQPDGRTETKDDVLSSYSQGDRRWTKAAVSDMAVTIDGDQAIVEGLWTAAGQNGDKAFDYSARFVSTWRKENGRWRNIAYRTG